MFLLLLLFLLHCIFSYSEISHMTDGVCIEVARQRCALCCVLYCDGPPVHRAHQSRANSSQATSPPCLLGDSTIDKVRQPILLKA